MEKFLSIQVVSGGVTTNTLVSVSGVKLIEPEAGTPATLTEIHYQSGKEITITHASVGAPSGTNSGTQFRRFLEREMTRALQQSWTNVVEVVNPEFEVSEIVHA